MKTSFGLIGLIVAVGMPALAQPPSPSDDWITTKAKLSLLTGDDVSSSKIHVDTSDGTVTIHGKVHSDAERARAESIVRRIDGVRDVRDLLQVVPGELEKSVKVSDERIEKSVAKVFKEEPVLKQSGISVKSVDKGVVLLSGKTDYMSDYLLAVECAHSVPGVRHVASEILVSDAADVSDVSDKRMATKTEWKERRAPYHSDSYMTAATKLRLINDGKVPSMDVKVDTDHGVVTLFGSVPNGVARAAAEADVRKVEGVVRVQNELEVVPKSERSMVKGDDKVIRSSVQDALKAHDFDHVDVAVENGAVRLTGSVPTIFRRLKAATVARSIDGVRTVNDDLRVTE